MADLDAGQIPRVKLSLWAEAVDEGEEGAFPGAVFSPSTPTDHPPIWPAEDGSPGLPVHESRHRAARP